VLQTQIKINTIRYSSNAKASQKTFTVSWSNRRDEIIRKKNETFYARK